MVGKEIWMEKLHGIMDQLIAKKEYEFSIRADEKGDADGGTSADPEGALEHRTAPFEAEPPHERDRSPSVVWIDPLLVPASASSDTPTAGPPAPASPASPPAERA